MATTTETKIIEIKIPIGEGIKQIQLLTAEIERLRAGQEKLKKGNEEEKQQYEKNAIAIKEYSRQKQVLQREVQTEIKATQSAMSAYQKLQTEYTKAAAKAKDLAASNTASAKEIKKAASEANALNDRLKSIDKTVGQSNRGIGEYERGISNIGKNFLSWIGLTSIIAGIGSALKNALGVVKEFDQQMANVAAITMATKEEMKQLRDIAIQYGTSTKFTASEVAGLEVELGKLGYTTQQIIDATGGVTMAAAATGESLQKTAEIVGSVTMAFGLSAGESQRVADVMSQSFNATALGLDNFSESIKYVAPVAKQVGVSVEETAALLGVLANNGIKGSMAGTALRRIFGELTKDSGTLQERLDQLAKTGLNLAGAQDEVGAHAKTALLVLKDQHELIPQLTKEFQNSAGASEAAAAKMMDTISGKSNYLKSTWESFILSVENGNGRFSRALKSMLSFAAESISGLQRLLMSESDVKKMDAQNAAQNRLKDFEKRAQSQKDYMSYLNQEIVAEKNLNQKRIDDINRLKKEIEIAENEGWTTYSTTRIKRLKDEAEGLTVAANKSTEYINTLGNLRRAKSDQTALEIKNQEIIDKNNKISLDNTKSDADKKLEIQKNLITGYEKITEEQIAEIDKYIAELKKKQEKEELKLLALDQQKNFGIKNTKTNENDIEQAKRTAEERKQNLINQLIDEAFIEKGAFEARKVELDLQMRQEIENKELTENQKLLIKKRYAKAESEIELESLNYKLQVGAQLANAVAEFAGRNTKIGKAAAVAGITLNAIQGGIAAVTKGVEQLGPVAGAIIGGAEAAAIALSAGAAIKQVYAVSDNISTSSGGGSSPSLPPDLTSKMASPLTNSVQTMGAMGGSNAITSGAANAAISPAFDYNAMAKVMSNLPAPELSIVELRTKERQVDFIDNISTLKS